MKHAPIWFLLLITLYPCAAAQPEFSRGGAIPPDGPRYRVGFNGRQVEVTDVHAQPPVMVIGGSTFPTQYQCQVASSVAFEPHPNGANLTFVFTNSTGAWKELGYTTIDGIRFGPNARRRWFNHDSASRPLPGFNYQSLDRYPNDTYSPVTVIEDDRYTVGISVLYPLLEHNQPLIMRLTGVAEASADNGGPHWALQAHFGDIPPFSTRQFTVAIRVAGANESFLSTLLPYREYFRSQFPPLSYQRDPRRIDGEVMADAVFLSQSNPRGYKVEAFRPDLFGWGRWVDRLLGVDGSNSPRFDRVLIWAPSGVMQPSTGLNFPFRFMTALENLPNAWSTLHEFARLPAEDVQLGFWWGLSVTVTQGWENPTATGLDPTNPQHRALAFAELDTAVAAGARLIGLDAFRMDHPADAWYWLQQLQARAPQVTFVTEYGAPDYIHALAPTFHGGIHITTPHLLADFLNPGHETWAAVTNTPESQAEGRTLTPAEIRAEVNRVESLGYVALVYGRPTLDGPGPTVTLPPRAASVAPQGEAQLRVEIAPSDVPVRFEWLRDGTPLTNGYAPTGAIVSGASTANLSLSNVTAADIGIYSVRISSDRGTTNPGGVPLLIDPSPAPACPRDYNRDGNIDPDDLGDFLNCFFVPGCAGADMNADGNIDPDDLGDYLNIFLNGCP